MKKFALFLVLCAAVFGLLYGAKFCRDTFAQNDGGLAVVTVNNLGRTDGRVMEDVQRTAEAFPQFMEEKFQVKLQRPTQIWVGADTAQYQELLTKRLGMEEKNAPQKAQYTNGQSSGRKAMVAIDGTRKKLGDSSECISTTAHELFHQLQYELSDGRSGYENSLFWLEEGTADYAGALLCEKLGGRSVDKWYRDARFTLQNARNVASVGQLQHTTEAERLDMMTTQAKHYTLADVMTMYLLKQYGGSQPEQKIVAYYKGMEKGEAEQVFAQTFGVELPVFLQEFSLWWQKELTAPAEVDTVIRPGANEAVARQFLQQVNLSRQWLKRNWGQDLHGHYQLVMVTSPEDFAAAMEEYCHVSREEAQKTADGSVWAENNSTVFVNLARVEDKRQAIFVSGTMMSRLFMMQQLGNDSSGMAWLLRGGSYVAGVDRLVEDGQGTLPAYQKAWRKELRQNAPLPAVDKLQTPEDLQTAMNQYGNDQVSRLCEYAAAELVNRYGWASLYAWQTATRQSGDGRQAFSKVFGLTLADFAAQIHLMIY